MTDEKTYKDFVNSFLGLFGDQLKTREIYELFIWKISNFVPDNFKTQEMCKDAFNKNILNLMFVPDHFKTREMCNKAVTEKPEMLMFVPDNFKTQEMCEDAFNRYLPNAIFVPEYFRTKDMI